MARAIAALSAALIVASLISPAFAKECADCPPDKPCGYTEKSDCNTCTGTAYCIDGKWYSTGVMACTTVFCGKVPILNPFKEDDLGSTLPYWSDGTYTHPVVTPN